MDWTSQLLKEEEQKDLLFSEDQWTTHTFSNLFTGIFKISYAPTRNFVRFVVEGPNYSEWWTKPWNVKMELTIRTFFRDSPKEEGVRKTFVVEFSDKAPSNKALINYHYRKGFNIFFIDPTLSFITTKVTFKVISHKGLPNSNMWKLIQQVVQPSNCRLIVDNNSIDVRKEFLVENSSVFKEMLEGELRENQVSEIEIKDVDYHQFIVFLAVMHGFYHPNIDHVVLDFLFRLSYKFQVSSVKDKCLEYINHLELHDLPPFLLLADNYDDATVVQTAIESIRSQQQHYGVLTSSEFQQLSEDSRKKILKIKTSKQHSNGRLSTCTQNSFQTVWPLENRGLRDMDNVYYP